MVLTDDVKSKILQEIISIIQGYTTFKVGTDSTPEDSSQTDLLNPVFSDTVDSIVPGTNNVVFKCYVDNTEANGYNLCEIGLFDSNGNMLLRKTFGTISKTSDINIWFEIQVVVSVS